MNPKAGSYWECRGSPYAGRGRGTHQLRPDVLQASRIHLLADLFSLAKPCVKDQNSWKFLAGKRQVLNRSQSDLERVRGRSLRIGILAFASRQELLALGRQCHP